MENILELVEIKPIDQPCYRKAVENIRITFNNNSIQLYIDNKLSTIEIDSYYGIKPIRISEDDNTKTIWFSMDTPRKPKIYLTYRSEENLETISAEEFVSRTLILQTISKANKTRLDYKANIFTNISSFLIYLGIMEDTQEYYRIVFTITVEKQ